MTKGAQAIITRNPGSVLAAQILAIRCGMDLCLQVGVYNVCIFSDLMEAVRFILGPEKEAGPLGVLAPEAHSMFINNNFVSFEYKNRRVNFVAHFLARRAINVSSDFLWLDENILFWLFCVVSWDSLM